MVVQMNNERSPNQDAPLKRILVIDDETNMRHMLSALLTKSGYDVDTAHDGHDGLNKVKTQHYNVILCDLKMPNMDGMEFLKQSKNYLDETTVIMMSAYGTLETAIAAMKLGAYDYISKPFKPDEVNLVLQKAQEREQLRQENDYLKKQIKSINQEFSFGNMIGKSSVMQRVFKLAQKVALYDTTVLVTGDSGTGKELIAKGIHTSSTRAKKQLIPVNCGSIPESLLESELFGYKRGAFTGADRDKKGLFEAADGGTILLDEIGELPLPLQVKLLRVLQENEIRPIGDSRSKTIDVRVIAATAKNLEQEVNAGNFREDLFYRLNVLPIKIPPLRARTEDIPLLSLHFVNKFAKNFGKEITGISPAAMSLLLGHRWPGNVRELENIIERAVILSEKKIILPENLPSRFGIKNSISRMDDFFEGFSLKKAQKVMEKRLIIRALEATGGNRTRAVKLLEISHPSLLSKIKEFDLKL
jgi:two-component system response regulator AtoC